MAAYIVLGGPVLIFNLPVFIVAGDPVCDDAVFNLPVFNVGE